MVDLEDGVFLYHAEQDEDPERRVEVQGVPRKPDRQQREGDAEREGEQDGEGVYQVLELGGEDHVHEGDRQGKGPDELAECPLELPPPPGNARGVGGGQVHRGHRGA